MKWWELLKEKPLLAAFVLLVLGAFLVLAFWAWQAQQREEPVLEEERELTKAEILEQLSAPEGAESRYTNEEKKEILDRLSAPEGTGSRYTEEEKEEILQKLSAPEDAESRYNN